MEKLDVRRVRAALAAWLGLLYILCIAGHTVLGLGTDTGAFRLFAMTLVGFDPSRPLSLLLGLLEVLLYGGLGGGLFAMVYNRLPSRHAAIPELFPRSHH